MEAAIKKSREEIRQHYYLANNAGIVLLSGGILNKKEEDWDTFMEKQLNAVFLLSKLVAKSM